MPGVLGKWRLTYSCDESKGKFQPSALSISDSRSSGVEGARVSARIALAIGLDRYRYQQGHRRSASTRCRVDAARSPSATARSESAALVIPASRLRELQCRVQTHRRSSRPGGFEFRVAERGPRRAHLFVFN